MSAIAKLSIRTRLGAAFAALIALAAMVGVVGLTRLQAISADLTLIRSDQVPIAERVVDIIENFNLISRELREALLWDEPAKVATSLQAVQTARAPRANMTCCTYP